MGGETVPPPPRATFFPSPTAFRAWLARNHATAGVLWVGFHRKATGRPTLTWSESVDEALCFGWIDGVRRKVDDTRYAIRFTPRRPGSGWSAVNVAKVAALEAAGKMRTEGRATFAARPDAAARPRGFDFRDEARLPPALARAFRAHPRAWAFFQAQPPGYRRLAAYWVASGKREETRARRFATLLADSAAGRRISLLERRPSRIATARER
jgi:uncharacterized protein YdeI (YjbR/CyaY-like superfamily)